MSGNHIYKHMEQKDTIVQRVILGINVDFNISGHIVIVPTCSCGPFYSYST